jgi:hypothetical protein
MNERRCFVLLFKLRVLEVFWWRWRGGLGDRDRDRDGNGWSKSAKGDKKQLGKSD